MPSIKLNLSRTKLEADENWDDETVASLRTYIVAEIQNNHPDATIICVEAGDENHSSVGVKHQYSDDPYFAEKAVDLSSEVRMAEFDWSDERYCIWCSAHSARPMPGADSGPPAPSTKDNLGWKAVAAMHNPGCEWVATRDLTKKACYGKYLVKLPAELEFETEDQTYTAKTLKSLRQIVAYAPTDALLARRYGPDAVEDGVARICFDVSTRAVSYSWANIVADSYPTRNEIPESAWKPARLGRMAKP